MDWLDNMNRALDYIETHLEDKINYEQVAQTACCSVYHFQRMFTFMTDVTLSEYVRRRKMTLAAQALTGSSVKIVDLALKYGYDSPEAFSRAFQALHGVSPSGARKPGIQLKAYPRVRFQITVKGVNEMNYRIIKKEGFQLYGVEKIVDITDGKNLIDIPKFWIEAVNDGTVDKLARSANYPTRVNAICGYRQLKGTFFPYMLCTIKTPLADTEGYTVVDVPAATWAVFQTEPHGIEETSNQIQGLISRFYTEWLPSADYDLVEGYDMELYHCCGDKSLEEVWFRVAPKTK